MSGNEAPWPAAAHRLCGNPAVESGHGRWDAGRQAFTTAITERRFP